MIVREGGQIEMVCDECGTESIGPYMHDEFDVMRDEAKQAGWRSVRIERDWQHFCAGCKFSVKE